MQPQFRAIQPSEATLTSAGDVLRGIPIEAEGEEATDWVLERDGYSVRPADSSWQRSKASTLIARRYSWRGYHTESIAALPHSRNSITLEASSGQDLFGTLTLGLDSPEGLLADANYGQKVNGYRATDRKLCEISKFAMDPQYGSKDVLATLFHLAYIHARILYKATDVLIEVHPRHTGFYQRRLGFSQIGEVSTCPRVNAPAVLLHVQLAYMQMQISRHGGSRDSREKSLYPYFLSRQEEQGLVHRIRRATLLPTERKNPVSGINGVMADRICLA